MIKYDLATIEAMHNMGILPTIEFGGGFAGHQYKKLTPVQVLECLHGGEDVLYSHIGVTAAQYREWRKSDGTALCMQRLKSGKFCGNQIGLQLDLDIWKSRHRNNYCHVHA